MTEHELIIGNKNLGKNCCESRHVNYLVGFALLIFALIIGYNAFILPDVEYVIQNDLDNLNLNFDEETPSVSDAQKININCAEKEELKKIKGIGEQVAEKIINYRETHGGFSNTKELLNVSGIGERTFEKIKDQITV